MKKDKGPIKRFQGFRRIMTLMAAGIFTVTCLAGCGSEKDETAAAAGIVVDTEPVESGTLEIVTEYIATLTPNLTVDVIPLVSGTVKKVTVKTGDRVKADDLLCQIDDTPADLSLKSAEDAVNSAKAGRDAAQTQTDTAKIQADSNVKTLKKTLSTYEKSLDTANKQLEKLKKSKNTIKKSQAAAKKAVADAKKRYKSAQAILIQFESFLSDHPDCKTTAGLTAAATTIPAAAIPKSSSSDTPQNLSGSDSASTSPQGTDSASSSPQGADPASSSPQGTNPASPTSPQDTDSASSGDAQGSTTVPSDNSNAQNTLPSVTPDNNATDLSAAYAKQKQAQALLSALTAAGLNVEYLSDTGLNALKEDASDASTAYTGVNTGLTQIDSGISTLKTNITQLKAQISSTKDSLATAKKLAKAADAGSDVYDAQVEAALTGVEAAEYQKSLYRLTAPIDGIVDAVNVKEDGVTAQGYAAFTISEKDSMIGTFYVSEEVKNYLKPGDAARLLRGDDEETEEIGHITSIGTATDPQKGLFKVEAEFITTGQKELSSGTSKKVAIVSNAVSGQLLIPYDSVYYDDGQAYVYTVIDGKAHRTDIETGLFNQEYIVVTSGLNAGDEIITSWASGLKDGAMVEVSGGNT